MDITLIMMVLGALTTLGFYINRPVGHLEAINDLNVREQNRHRDEVVDDVEFAQQTWSR